MDMSVLYKVSYGLYIVSSKDGETINGQIANTALQVSADPSTLIVCLNKENYTHELVSKSNVYNVSILAQDAPMDLIANFGFKSGRDIEKFKNISYELDINGVPMVTQHVIGSISVIVDDTMDCGTHTIFKGRIVDTRNISRGDPMTYAYYHDVKNGRSPKAAPINIIEEKGVTAGMKKCKVCGYVYDPEKGAPPLDPMPFEDLPDDWVCPVCGAAKEKFRDML